MSRCGEAADYAEQLELLDMARAVQSECLRPGCRRQRLGQGGPLLVDDPASYCDQHADAL